MAINFKGPTEVGDDYLTELKSLKPTFNTSQTDSEWWIRSRVLGGIAAGIYADQRLIANDAFPQRARTDALLRSLDLYFESGFLPATQAQGNVIVTGSGTFPSGITFLFSPNGNSYASNASTTITGPTGLVPVTSVGTGQNQNLNPGAQLTISSPPNGFQPTAVVDPNGLADARDPETNAEASARIVQRIRQPLSVGRVSDYIQYAGQADPSVTGASVVRYPFGLGTVGVYIISGTTNIDAAIDAGIPISIIPSDALVAKVQAFLELNKPVTDCVTVFKPTPLPIDVTIRARFVSGDASTVPSGQTLTQGQLVQREVSRALFKTPVGGRVFGGIGYVLASEIEETIDANLSGEAVTQGVLQLLSDRDCLDLSATGTNRMILPNEAPIPGNISVITF